MFSNPNVFKTKDRAQDRLKVDLKEELETNLIGKEEEEDEDGLY